MAGTLEKSDVPNLHSATPTSEVKSLAEDQGIEAAKDIAFGSVRMNY